MTHLNEEERDRIYQEEKIRKEAQGQFKTGKQSKKRFVMIFVALSLAISVHSQAKTHEFTIRLAGYPTETFRGTYVVISASGEKTEKAVEGRIGLSASRFEASGSFISATFEKTGGASGTLALSIVSDGILVKSSTAINGQSTVSADSTEEKTKDVPDFQFGLMVEIGGKAGTEFRGNCIETSDHGSESRSISGTVPMQYNARSASSIACEVGKIKGDANSLSITIRLADKPVKWAETSSPFGSVSVSYRE